jgi:hypothetical protein
MKTQELKLQRKSYKFGSYATSEYYVNGELVGETSSHQKECGTGWFMDLTSEEDAIMEEISINDVPDNIYDKLKEDGKI